MHVDTGSFYRTTTLKLIEAGVAPESGPDLESGLTALKLGTEIHGNQATITINDWLPDDAIRSQMVNDQVSHFAALPELRSYLLDYQRTG